MSARALLVLVLLVALQETSTAGVGKVWDVSAANKMPYPLRFFQWSKTDGTPFHIKTITGVGRTQKVTNEHIKRSKRQTDRSEEEQDEGRSEHADPNMNYRELITKMDNLDEFTKSSAELGKSEDDYRERRESDKQMEKIGGATNVDRLSSKRSESQSQSWSKQPISVEFRHRTNLDDATRMVPSEDPLDAYRNRQPQRIDFVTSGRRYYSGEREGRDLPMARQMYEDYDMHPIFRNYNGRARDYQIPISRAMYPNRYKGERDYYYRIPVDMRMKVPPVSVPSAYYPNRYRLDMEGEDQYMDHYGRRPTVPTKPKRIIYYATLPEIVRKPIDIRNYPRYSVPYPQTSRVPNVDRNGVRVRPTSALDPTRRPYNKFTYPVVYKYSNMDSWNKRPNQYEQISQAPYRSKEEVDQERMNENKDDFQGSDSTDEMARSKQINLSRMKNEEQRVQWLMQAASKVNAKENEQISGRKTFGRVDGYDDRNRYQDNRGKEVVIDQEMSDT